MENNKKILILVAEDDPALSSFYKTALEAKNFEVILAYNGNSAIALAKEKKPQLIILDVLMPEVDGITVLKKLREDSETKDIKVIMATVLESEQVKEEALKLGVNDFLVKSNVSLEDIIKKVESYFSIKF